MAKERKSKVKNVKRNLILATAGALVVVGVFACIQLGNFDTNIKQPDTMETGGKKDVKVDEFYSSLNFKTMKYGDKTYLTIDENDLLKLIEKAMAEVDQEYLNMGGSPVFSSKDTEYSRFKPEHIYGLMYTETTLRILEVKDKNNGVYNLNNYDRFSGRDKNGVVYYGLGMMNEKTLKYINEQDRKITYGMEDTRIQCGDKKIELKFENLNPYDYVLNSGAKTENEIKKALAECIMFNAKTTYIYLNRIVKDNLKIGSHDSNLDKLLSYNQLDNLSEEEVMMFFAFLGYNQGPNLTMESVKNNTLFSKDEKGEYKNNLKYSNRVFNYANEYLNNNLSK